MSAVQQNGSGLSAEFAQKNNNTPASSTDITNKAYVDAFLQGLSPKNSVVAASAAALPAYTYANGAAGVGATITKTTPGALTLDGVTGFSVGDRVLIKDETAANAPYNGIYVVTVPGGVAAFVLTRATDNDQSADFPGAFVFCESGTVNTGAGFVCTNTAGVVVGTTAITWTQFSGAGEITAGAGLTKSGNTLNVGAGDGIQADADSVTVKLDGSTLTKGASGLKISTSGVANANLANMNDQTIKGNVSGGAAAPSDLTMAQVAAALPAGTTSAQGAVQFNSDGGATAGQAVQGNDTRLLEAKLGGLWFAAGADSSLTLGSNTTLASTNWCKNYTSLDLAGFTLSQTSTDVLICVYVSGTLTLGGGTIKSTYVRVAAGSGGNGDTGHSPSGYGGAGGDGTGGVFVYAYTISGTGTITAAGVTGASGNNGSAVPAGQVNGGSGGTSSGSSSTVYGTLLTVGAVTNTFGGGAAGGGNTTGGTAGAGSAGPTAAGTSDFTAALRIFTDLVIGNNTVTQTGTGGKKHFSSAGGGGGGGGGGNGAAFFAGAGGGAGAGGAGWWPGQTGGNGGAGGNSLASGTAGGQGGGGGGGGGAGSLVVVMCVSAGAGLTVTAAGGGGGNGGNAFGASSNGGGGGTGGGGCGGIAVYVGKAGPTVTAAAGIAGATVGLKTGGGSNGSLGTNGQAGIAMAVTT
jgi:hypothetical protein